MYQKLMTKEVEKRFDKYPVGTYQSSSLEEVYNAPVIAKFFNPYGTGTWLALEGSKMENGDYEMWGYCHLGDDRCAEFGYFYLSELESIKIRPFGLKIERDISVNGKKSLKEEMRLSCIAPSFEVKEHLENTIKTINSFQNKETNKVILNDDKLNYKRRIVVLKPNEKPEIQLVNDELENFQAIVGGYIQYVPMPNRDDIDIWCNEEGKLMGLKPNLLLSEYGDCVVGTCYFCATDGEKSLSLSKEQIDAVNKFIKTHAILTDLDNEQE